MVMAPVHCSSGRCWYSCRPPKCCSEPPTYTDSSPRVPSMNQHVRCSRIRFRSVARGGQLELFFWCGSTQGPAGGPMSDWGGLQGRLYIWISSDGISMCARIQGSDHCSCSAVSGFSTVARFDIQIKFTHKR